MYLVDNSLAIYHSQKVMLSLSPAAATAVMIGTLKCSTFQLGLSLILPLQVDGKDKRQRRYFPCEFR
jgi:hypothetical protein